MKILIQEKDNAVMRAVLMILMSFCEFCGFSGVIVGLLVTIAHIFRPSVLSFLSSKDFDLSRLQRRSERIYKIRLLLCALCTLEFVKSIVRLFYYFLQFSPFINLFFTIKTVNDNIGYFTHHPRK